MICACRGLRPDCDDRVRISIRSLKIGAPPRVKDIQTSLLGPLYPHDTSDRVSRQNQQRRSAMSSTFRCDLPISELRVDLRGPPCGASDVQMVPGAEP